MTHPTSNATQNRHLIIAVCLVFLVFAGAVAMACTVALLVKVAPMVVLLLALVAAAAVLAVVVTRP